MNRPVAERLRAAADRVDQLPASLPDPKVDVHGTHVHVAWRDATAHVGRAVIEALPGNWKTSDSFMYRTDPGGVVTMWWVYFEKVQPVSSVNPADLLAEAAS
jgi:hypothetical protein